MSAIAFSLRFFDYFKGRIMFKIKKTSINYIRIFEFRTTLKVKQPPLLFLSVPTISIELFDFSITQKINKIEIEKTGGLFSHAANG